MLTGNPHPSRREGMMPSFEILGLEHFLIEIISFQSESFRKKRRFSLNPRRVAAAAAFASAEHFQHENAL